MRSDRGPAEMAVNGPSGVSPKRVPEEQQAYYIDKKNALDQTTWTVDLTMNTPLPHLRRSILKPRQPAGAVVR